MFIIINGVILIIKLVFIYKHVYYVFKNNKPII